MSIKNFSLAIGLTALGTLIPTASTRVVAQEVAPPSPSVPSTSNPAAPSPVYTVLLLNNGRILQGKISEDASGTRYVYTAKNSGEIEFPKSEVEKAFPSMNHLYRHKVDRLPEGDADERMKFSKWCLEQDLVVEAKDQLTVVLQLSPNFLPAQRMMANIDATLANRDKPRTGPGTMAGSDPSVARASAEIPAADDRVGRAEMDPKVNRVRHEMMKHGGVPVVFDLPNALAVQRAREYAANVHPVLQQHCARCHDEKYNGQFQLVPVRIRRDLTPLVVFANLDATLPLINRDAPDRSELLAAALLPHGPNHRPILKGPNDPAYRALSNWASRLGVASTPVDRAVSNTGGTASMPSPSGSEEQFGADRGLAPSGSGPGLVPVRPPALSPIPPRALMSGALDTNPDMIGGLLRNAERFDYQRDAMAPAVPMNSKFPVSPIQGGTALPPVNPALPTPGAKPVPVPLTNTDPNAPKTSVPTKSKAKPLDPALLEKILKARQQTQP